MHSGRVAGAHSLQQTETWSSLYYRYSDGCRGGTFCRVGKSALDGEIQENERGKKRIVNKINKSSCLNKNIGVYLH